MDYNSTFATISVHKLYKSFKVFLCTFSPFTKSMSLFAQNMLKNRADFCSVFVSRTIVLCPFYAITSTVYATTHTNPF